MRRFAWSFTALALISVACGPTGQTEVKPPADLQITPPGAEENAKKAGTRQKSVNASESPSTKPID